LIELIQDRIRELMFIIERTDKLILNSESSWEKRFYSNKREWLGGLLEVNVRIYERIKELSFN
jgi:hypothetical protein